MRPPWFNLLVLLVLLVGCAPQPWKQDPDVQAAKQDCAGLPQGEHYVCIERHAVTSLDPEVCRLASVWVDDACLQAVYQAADDPATCERLYRPGVAKTCRAYYRRPAVDFATSSSLNTSGELGHQMLRYQVMVIHYGNRPVEDLTAWLLFPEAEGLPMQVRLQRTEIAPADLVKPNQGRVYEGEIAWETEHSKQEIGAVLDRAQIRLAWTLDGERQEKLFPLSTEKGPDWGTNAFSPQPTSTPQPTAPAVIAPSPQELPSQTPEEDAFPRTSVWFNAYGSEYPTDEQLLQLVDAFSADVIAYLQETIEPTEPLVAQSPSLTQMAADLPLFEGGQVVPVELDSGTTAELFVLPNFRAIGGPMLYVRYTDAGWQTFPVPVVPPGGGKAVANAPNLWPASAEVRDVTGDGQVEIIVRHTFAGGSNWREHPQVLRWNGAGFNVLFRAELVNWAEQSEWRFVPHGSAQDIVITYPIFMPSRPQKFDPHPEGVQRWRYDPAADRYVLWATAVQTPLPWLGDLATAETAFRASDYRTALTAYQSFLSDETWQEDFLHDYRAAMPGAGERELAAWLDLARLHAGLCHAALEEPTAVRQVLSAVESAPQAGLAAAFLTAYGEDADLVAALAAYEGAIATSAQANEQPQTGGGMWSLYPQPYGELILLNRDPALLKAAIQDHDLPAEGFWADLDDDGRDEFVWLDVGEWHVVWVAWQDADGRWQATGLEAEDDLSLARVHTSEIVVQYCGEERVFEWDGELKMAQVPPARRISDWPLVGTPALSTTQ